ncbi:hypothetical protein CR513_17568, partial [Mucuna pruriens]
MNKRLQEAKGRWVEELPQVLWLYHTTPHSTIQENSFRLTFGTNVVIPVEIGGDQGLARFATRSKEIAHVKEVVAKARGGTGIQFKGLSQKDQKGGPRAERVLKNNTRNKLTSN